MTSAHGPAHVVVDGSNIATEGRSLPSLAQLSEAVMSFMEEHPDTAVTVVVDATFGHRIDKKEVKEFEEGIANNELVAPPAGAVGRGDAFVLAIADKSNASILSNDSFQEFHGDYTWLFDEGRLIGGKPVPHVGWVFVDRVPVRGPVSRKATGARGSRRSKEPKSSGRGRKASAAASEPMPVPTSPPPGRGTSKDESGSVAADGVATRRSAPRAGDVVNELMPFLEFVEHHPVGTSVNGTVESYSSHGAYVSIGNDGVRGYVPLRLMADPAPTSARKVMRIGESVTLVVVNFAAARRSIDCAMPDLAQAAIESARADGASDSSETALDVEVGGVNSAARDSTDAASSNEERTAPAKKTSAAKRTAAKKSAAKKAPATRAPAKRAPAKRTAAKKSAATKSAADAPAQETPEKKAPTRRSAAKKSAATNVPAEETPEIAPAKETPAKRAAATKASATKVPAKEPAKKGPAKKRPAKKAPAKKTATKRSATDEAPVKKAPAKSSAAKKAPTKRSAAKRSAAPKVPAEETPETAPAKKTPARRSAARKASSKRAPAKKVGGASGSASTNDPAPPARDEA